MRRTQESWPLALATRSTSASISCCMSSRTPSGRAADLLAHAPRVMVGAKLNEVAGLGREREHGVKESLKRASLPWGC